jgi:dihydrofolate reductase
MRKLKLQMQITADGYVAGPQGQLDWMTFNMDAPLLAFINELTDSSDTILLGRKMTPGVRQLLGGCARHARWSSDRVRAEDGWYPEGGIQEEGRREAAQEPSGRNIIVYGGAKFVSSLIQHDLIDELNLFVNPVAIGEGLRVLSGRKALKLHRSVAYACGIVVNTYQ